MLEQKRLLDIVPILEIAGQKFLLLAGEEIIPSKDYIIEYMPDLALYCVEEGLTK
jgi:hypothetical protein